MLILLLVFAAAVVIGISAYRDDSVGGWPFGLGMFAMSCVIGVFVAFLLSLVVSMIPVGTYDTTERHNLAVLQDGTKTSGSFFLLAGHIDNDAVFRYYVETRPGVYKFDWQYADWAEVAQDTKTPYVEVVKHHQTKWLNLFGDTMDDDNYIFHVPPGSIKTDYTLDAK